MCVHPRFTKSKAGKKLWLNPTSDAFKALQSNLNYLTKFSHTGILETFYALYNKWIPKSQHVSHLAMVTRIQLAIIDLTLAAIFHKQKQMVVKENTILIIRKKQNGGQVNL